MFSAAFNFAYLVALLASSSYAMVFGGRPERQGAAIMLAGSILSIPAADLGGRGLWAPFQYGLLVVDLGVLAAFLALALRSDRFWPLWATGFHVVAISIHFATLASSAIIPRAYSLAQPFWAYPMLVAMVLGTISHHQRARRQSQSH